MSTHQAFEPSITSADPERLQHRSASHYQMFAWMEQQQEEAEIHHLRAQIRTNGRVGVMELY